MAHFCNTVIMRTLLDATFNLAPEQQAAFERMHNCIAMATQFRPGEERPQEFTDAVIDVRKVIAQVIEARRRAPGNDTSVEHTSQLHSLMRISYAVYCMKQKNSLITFHQRTVHPTHQYAVQY